MKSKPKRDSRWSIRVSVKVRRRVGRSGDAASVAATFGLPRNSVESLWSGFRLDVRPGQIVAVIGPSGAGKSVLLREAADKIPGAIFVHRIGPRAGQRAAVETLSGGTLKSRLEILSRLGLAEATALVTPAGRLSEGQRYRLTLARALHRAERATGPRLIVADEFCASLDGVTAAVLCRQVRKLLRASRAGLLLATPRVELLGPLRPDRVIVKPMGAAPHTRVGWRARAGPSPDPRRWRIVPGRLGDYRQLAPYHYLTGPPAAHKRVYVIRTPHRWRRQGGPGLAAVLVVSPPVPDVRGRNIATARRYCGGDHGTDLRRLNAEVECVSRVIVHPIFRGCGLAVRLVRHALRTAEAPVMEALAAMGKVHPFFVRAGMRPVGVFRGRTRYYHYYIAFRD